LNSIDCTLKTLDAPLVPALRQVSTLSIHSWSWSARKFKRTCSFEQYSSKGYQTFPVSSL